MIKMHLLMAIKFAIETQLTNSDILLMVIIIFLKTEPILLNEAELTGRLLSYHRNRLV